MEQKRRSFLEEILERIRNVPRYSDFYLNTFYVIASIGLQLKAKREKLFENEDWDNPECHDDLIRKIEKFLDRNIK